MSRLFKFSSNYAKYYISSTSPFKVFRRNSCGVCITVTASVAVFLIHSFLVLVVVVVVFFLVVVVFIVFVLIVLIVGGYVAVDVTVVLHTKSTYIFYGFPQATRREN